MPAAQTANGKLRLARVTYVTTGLETSGDVIELVKLKAGAVLVPALSWVVWEPFGADFMGPLGTGSNNGRLSQTFTITGISSGTIVADALMGATDGWDPQPLAAGDEVVKYQIMSVAGVATPGKKIVFGIAYVDE